MRKKSTMSFQIIDISLWDQVSQEAKMFSHLRMNYNFHKTEHMQQMLN